MYTSDTNKLIFGTNPTNIYIIIYFQGSLQQFGQNVDNRLRDTRQTVDNKLIEGSDFLSNLGHELNEDIDESNKRAHAGLDEAANAASNILGKGLFSHK